MRAPSGDPSCCSIIWPMFTTIALTLLGAFVGSLVTWMLGARDRAQAKKALAAQQAASDAQQRIAQLEAERSRYEALARFVPKSEIVEHEGKQFIRLGADDSFEVESIDYLTANEARVASRPVGKTGKIVEVPIDEAPLVEIRRLGPWVSTFDLSAEVTFRFHLRKDGQYKEYRHKGLIKPELKGSVQVNRVIG